MIKKLIAFIFIVMATAAYAEDWRTPPNNSYDIKAQFDFDSTIFIEPKLFENTMKVTVLASDPDYQIWRKCWLTFLYDCENLQYKGIRAVALLSDGRLLPEEPPPEHNVWRSVIPESNADWLMNIICKKAK